MPFYLAGYDTEPVYPWWEFDATGGARTWHDNILTGQPGLCHWPPAIPWGFPAGLAETGREVYEAFAPGIDHIVEHDLLTYTPVFHPWSIYRVSREAEQIDLLLAHAKRVALPVSALGPMYEKIAGQRSLAAAHPTWSHARRRAG